MQQTKIEWADNIRFFATVSVVLLHVASSGLYLFGKIDTGKWMIANIADTAVRFCVPIFFMLSGSLLLTKEESLSQFFKKRFFKIIPPFLFWSLLYTLMYSVVFYFKGKHVNLSDCIFDFLFNRGFFSQFAYHLWYIYVLLGIYLITPVLKFIFKQNRKISIPIYIIFWIVAVVLHLKFEENGGFLNYFLKVIAYSGYFVAGYFLTKITIKLKSWNKLILISSALILISFTSIFTYFKSKNAGELNLDLYNFLLPNIMIYSLIVFLLIKSYNFRNERFIKIRDLINKFSYGIYLSHVMFVWVFEAIGFDWQFIHPLLAIPVLTVVITGLSALTVYILRRTPFLKIFAA